MRQREFKRRLSALVLGASAAPVMLLPGCGRSDLIVEPDASVIPSRDGSVTFDGGRDASVVFDAGADAGPLDGGYRLVSSCGDLAWFPDGGTWSRFDDAGVTLDLSACVSLCPMTGFTLVGCTLLPESSELACWDEFCAVGRQAEAVTQRSAGPAAGRHFSAMAALEATAVFAFEDLAHELETHRLPGALAAGARRAAQEERRHTALTARFAAAQGGSFSVARAQAPQVRSLEALALDNAVEGCVRETLGALVGLHQARFAADPSVRALFATVAEDELGHAAWSWSLAAELGRRLAPAARRRVAAARDEALARMPAQVLGAVTEAERVALGLPDAETFSALQGGVRTLAGLV